MEYACLLHLIGCCHFFSTEQTAWEDHSKHFEEPQHLQGGRSIRHRGLNQWEASFFRMLYLKAQASFTRMTQMQAMFTRDASANASNLASRAHVPLYQWMGNDACVLNLITLRLLAFAFAHALAFVMFTREPSTNTTKKKRKTSLFIAFTCNITFVCACICVARVNQGPVVRKLINALIYLV